MPPCGANCYSPGGKMLREKKILKTSSNNFIKWSWKEPLLSYKKYYKHNTKCSKIKNNNLNKPVYKNVKLVSIGRAVNTNIKIVVFFTTNMCPFFTHNALNPFFVFRLRKWS